VWSDKAFNTPDWNNYKWVGTTSKPLDLKAGEHTITVCVDAGDANLDKFRYVQNRCVISCSSSSVT
jgi:hypothetical protein